MSTILAVGARAASKPLLEAAGPVDASKIAADTEELPDEDPPGAPKETTTKSEPTEAEETAKGEAEAAVLTGGLVSSGCSDETADVAETIDSERWAVVNRDGTVLAEDDGLPLTTASVEANIEQLLTWMLAPAVHGILNGFSR